MGLNISIYKIVNKSEEELWGGGMVPFYETIDQDWFDFSRYAGDREFVRGNIFIGYDDSDEYVRPESFEKCRDWISNNDCHKDRLNNALDKMEEDKDLVFRFSW